MNDSISPPAGPGPESLYTAVTRWAGHAPRMILGTMGGLGALAAPGILILDWHYWPLAGIALGAGSIGAWGMLEQRAGLPHTRRVTLLESVLTGIGLVGALLGMMGLLFWSLGDAPNH